MPLYNPQDVAAHSALDTLVHGVPATQKVLETGQGHININPHNFSASTGTWALTTTTNLDIYNFYIQNTGDGDTLSYKIFLAKGTYTLQLIFRKDTNCGIIDVDIDAAEVASLDGYNNPAISNAKLTQASIAVAVAGIKTLRIRVDGKHGSSSGYLCKLSLITLWRTA